MAGTMLPPSRMRGAGEPAFAPRLALPAEIAAGPRQNRELPWGGELAPAGTEGFSQASCPEILEKVERLLYPQNQP